MAEKLKSSTQKILRKARAKTRWLENCVLSNAAYRETANQNERKTMIKRILLGLLPQQR